MVNVTVLLATLSLINHEPLVARVFEGLGPALIIRKWSTIHFRCEPNRVEDSLIDTLLREMAAKLIPVQMCSTLAVFKRQTDIGMHVESICTDDICSKSITINFNASTASKFEMNSTSVTELTYSTEPDHLTVYLKGDILTYWSRTVDNKVFGMGRNKALLNDLNGFMRIPLKVLIHNIIPMFVVMEEEYPISKPVSFGQIHVPTKISEKMYVDLISTFI